MGGAPKLHQASELASSQEASSIMMSSGSISIKLMMLLRRLVFELLRLQRRLKIELPAERRLPSAVGSWKVIFVCFTRRWVDLKDAKSLQDDRGVESIEGMNAGEDGAGSGFLRSLRSSAALSENLSEKCESANSRTNSWTRDLYSSVEKLLPLVLSGAA